MKPNKGVAEEALEKVTEEVIVKQETNMPVSPIQQIGNIAVDDSKAHFEVKVEAHEKCTNKDVIEVIQENFFGTLDQKHVGKTDPIRHLIIREEKDKLLEIPVQGKYRIVVRDDKLATDIVALWNEPYEFDELAFKNAIYDKIKIKIKEVKRVR